MKIFIDATAGACEQFAAEELQKFLEECSGTRCDISNETPHGDGFRIGLRENKNAPQDMFAVERKDGILDIVGNSPRAALYGVYDVLEKFFGVRFVAQDCTYVPKRDLTVPQANYKEIPAIELRDYFCTQTSTDSLFAARCRMLTLYGKEEEKYGYGLTHVFDHLWVHNTATLADAEQNFDKYPTAYFEHTYPHGAKQKDICFTELSGYYTGKPSPVADIVVENLKKEILRNTSAKYFQIGQQDIPFGCPCENCKKMDRELGTRSVALIMFVNYVARKIREWANSELGGREINIVTFAYEYTRFAPVLEKNGKKIVLIRPDDNVYIRLAPSTANYAYSFSDKRQFYEFRKMIADWRMVTDRFFFWDYTINFYEEYWYFPTLKVMRDNYRLYAEMGVKHVFSEGSGNDTDFINWQNDLRCYVAAHLMWNPEGDTWQYVREFCELYYGDAASSVLAMIDDFENEIEKQRIARGKNYYIMISWGKRTLRPHHYTREFLEKQSQRIAVEIEKARSAGDEVLTRRLEDVRMTPDRMLLRNADHYYTAPERKELCRKVYKNWQYLRKCDAWRRENERLEKLSR